MYHKDSYYKRTIERKEIASVHLNETRSLVIYLPPGYNELISYPIVYTQDGQDFFMFGRIPTLANYLILEKDMDPPIIVGVDVSRKNRTAEYLSNGERNTAYRRFFVEEVVPFVEQLYPVPKHGVTRILAGDSLGGMVSLDLAIDHPALFPNVLSLSGAFFPSLIQRLEAENNLSWLNLYMVIGQDETAIKTDRGEFDFLEMNREALRVLEAKKAGLRYVEKPGDHKWGFWQQELPDALMYFLGKR